MAVMGSAMARVLFDIDRPTVGLLNIGVEEVKGLEAVREAGRILREEPLPHIDYVGFVEGDDIGKGTVDVVVTEGFAGNIALKTAEGTARQFADYLRDAMSQSIWSKIGYLLARPAFRMLRDKMDPRKSNGGVFLGLNGVVIKSHGGTDAGRLRRRHRRGLRHGALRTARQDRRNHPSPRRRERRGRGPSAERPREHAAFGRSRLRQLSAGAHSHQRRSSRRASTPPTNGSCSAPASASATSRPTAR